METSVKSWTNIETNYIFPVEEKKKMLRECFWDEEPADGDQSR